MVRPILEYGTIIWSTTSKKNLIKIEGVQRNATKYVTRGYHMDYVDRLIRCKLLPLSLRREYLDCLYMYKALHGLTDNYIVNKVTFSRLRTRIVVNDDTDVGNLVVRPFHTDSLDTHFEIE